MLGGEGMEFTIKKILSIDKEVQEYKKSIEKTLVDKRRELDEYIRTLDKEYNSETERMKEVIIKNSVLEAEKITNEIKLNRQEQVEMISNLYNKNKNSIVNEIFEYIISSCVEG